MDLNQQIEQNQRSQGNAKFIFKDGVKYRHMTDSKQAMVFRFLPAFDPNNRDPRTSALPFVAPDGRFTKWGMILNIARFIGHGKGGISSRRDLLSLQTFGKDRAAECPILRVIDTVNKSGNDWAYLFADQKDPATGKILERKALSKPLPHFVANIVDLNQIVEGVKLGVFTSSATDSITNPTTGLIFQRNNLPDEVVKTNYLLNYAVGDLTHPASGPALVCAKGNDRGDFSGYLVTMAKDTSGRPISRSTAEFLGGRYNLDDMDSFVNVPTAQDLVDALVQLLNGRSQQGWHEYSLLKMALPEFRIPDPPMAMGASPTIQAGAAFGPPPVNAPPTWTPNPPVVTAPANAPEPSSFVMGVPPSAPAPMPAPLPAPMPVTQTSPPVVIPGEVTPSAAASFAERLSRLGSK